MGVGNTPAAPADTSSLSTYWNNNQDRFVEIEYLKATNSATVRVYEGLTNSGTFAAVSFSPTGGASVAANATWTLPAASFFVTATTGPTQATSIQISNLTVSGVSGAANIIQPLQQTTLTVSRAAGGPAATVSQTQDVVFQADANGDWRLQGLIRLSGIQGGGRATGAELAFSFLASADDTVPEPGTWGLMLSGLGCLAGVSAWTKRKKELA